MQPSNIHLIINRRSRKTRKFWTQIQAELALRNLSPDFIHDLDGKTSLDIICETVVIAEPTLVIIGGGDGTVSSALHHFVGTDIELGIIPLGTTNNFCRSLNIPTNISDAIEVMKRTKAHPVDLGNVNGLYFANVVGVGLSTAIAQSVTNKAKRRWGRLAYAYQGLRQLSCHKAFTVSLSDKDGELTYSFETHQVIIANGRFHAGKQIAADAAIDNRELVMFALGGRGWLSFTWHTLDFYLGRRKQILHSSIVVGHTILLQTNRKQIVEVDGETGGSTPLHLSVKAGAVKVRYKL